ncbi:MAG: type II toxin-antitoxin system RelE/ParE family toxin [Bacilli bacterium]
MKVAFLPPAAAELTDAVAFYNQQSEGLGFQFAVEVQRTIDRIAEFPEAWPVLSERTRRCRMRRFPYGLIYHMRDETLLIVAVMHLHRHPDVWRDLLPSADA